MKIGIPRALHGFLIGDRAAYLIEAAGHEPVWSPPSTPQILALGEAVAPHDLCLPVKLHMGHVLELAPRTDRIFLPRLISLDARRWLCPHFLGLPDTVRAMAPRPLRLLTATWDARRTGDARSGWRQLAKSLALTSIPDLLSVPETPPAGHRDAGGEGPRIALLGHPYILGDPILSADMSRRLQRAGCRVLGASDVPESVSDRRVAELTRPVFWYSAHRIVGSAFELLEGAVDGVVLITTFGCGPDSLIRELVEIRARERIGTPLLSLVVDEHLSTVGLETRIEAFLDMVRTTDRRCRT